MTPGLSPDVIEKIKQYGVLQFSFEDTLLALDLECIDKEQLPEAQKSHRKGLLAGELVLRKKLYDQAEGGNVGAAKELISAIRKDSSQKKNSLPSR